LLGIEDVVWSIVVDGLLDIIELFDGDFSDDTIGFDAGLLLGMGLVVVVLISDIRIAHMKKIRADIHR